MKNNIKYSLKKATTSIAMFSTLLLSQTAFALDITKPKAVVELYTSQGCHACPPADKTFAKMVENREEILGLAFHVDYWDRLGWKDTFSDQEYTLRQYNYSWAMGQNHAYTPQAIVNGRKQIIGTKDDQIEEWSDKYSTSDKGMKVPIEVSEDSGLISIKVDGQGLAANSNLYAVYFDPFVSVKIEGGYNRGKKIDYANIVRRIELIGQTKDTGLDTALSLDQIKQTGFENVAFILQGITSDGLPGPINGATVISAFKGS